MNQRAYSLGILLLICLPFWGHGQINEHVFILTDVSGSVNRQAAAESKTLINELLGGKFNPGKFSDWNFASAYEPNVINIKDGKNAQALIGAGKTVFLMEVGEKNTVKSGLQKTTIQTPGTDLKQFLDNHYPTTFSDANTYLLLARAEAAKTAKMEGIKDYILIEATDSDDDVGQISYNNQEKALIGEYSAMGRVKPEKLGIIYYEGPGRPNYKITIWQVEHINFNPPGVVAPPTNIQKEAKLSLNGVGKTESIAKEYEVEKQNFSWTCTNCDGAKYRVLIKKKEGNSFKIYDTQNSLSTRQSRNKELSSGIYEISVSTIGLDRNVTDKGYVEITGGGGGFLWVLLLLGIIGAGIWGFNKLQRGGNPASRTGYKIENEYSAPGDDLLNPPSPTSSDDPFA